MQNIPIHGSISAWACVVLAMACAGCGPGPTPPPPPAPDGAVLAGTWALTTQNTVNPDLTSFELTFDSNGQLVSITYVFQGITTTLNQGQVTATSAVTGSVVSIDARFGDNAQNSLLFNGTLNAAETVITGTASLTLIVGATTIFVPLGPAALTKVTAPPPEESVLAGTWTLTPQTSPNTDLTSLQLTFDSNGELTRVSYVFDNVTFVQNAANLDSSVSVTGDQVSISTTFAGPSAITFTGTLNEDQTVAVGTVSFTLVIGSVIVTAPTGPATLTKGTVPPPVPSVLAGSWTLVALTNPNPGLTNITLTFNNNGDLTEIRFVLNGVTTIVAGNDLNSSTTLAGNQLSVSATFAGPSAVSFTGTLDATQTSASGVASFSVVLGGTTITAGAGPGTLTKVGS